QFGKFSEEGDRPGFTGHLTLHAEAARRRVVRREGRGEVDAVEWRLGAGDVDGRQVGRRALEAEGHRGQRVVPPHPRTRPHDPAISARSGHANAEAQAVAQLCRPGVCDGLVAPLAWIAEPGHATRAPARLSAKAGE